MFSLPFRFLKYPTWPVPLFFSVGCLKYNDNFGRCCSGGHCKIHLLERANISKTTHGGRKVPNAFLEGFSPGNFEDCLSLSLYIYIHIICCVYKKYVQSTEKYMKPCAMCWLKNQIPLKQCFGAFRCFQ